MINRRALMAAVASGSISAGVGWAWWRAAAESGRRQEDSAGLWKLRFVTPDGGQVALSRFKGWPLALNFWASWCPPCVDELPLLDLFYRRFNAQGWEVLGLAVEDSPVLVREFLAKHPVTFSIGLAGIRGVNLSRSLGNGPGALPFTAVFNRQGQLLHRKLGVLTLDELSSWPEKFG